MFVPLKQPYISAIQLTSQNFFLRTTYSRRETRVHRSAQGSFFNSISLFKPGILLQRPIALLEGVSTHFSNASYTILKNTWGRARFSTPTNLVRRQLRHSRCTFVGRETKWRHFRCYFEISSGNRKSRI